jgi:hypothetical protein
LGLLSHLCTQDEIGADKVKRWAEAADQECDRLAMAAGVNSPLA